MYLENFSMNVYKIIELLFQVSMFNVIQFICSIWGNGKFSVYRLIASFLPVNYFVVLYIVLYIISPYINIVFGVLVEKKQMKNLLILVFAIFSVWPTMVDILENITGPMNGLSTISAYGSDNGYTIVNFVLMYILGAGIRMTNIKIKKLYSGIAIVTCTTAIVFMSVNFGDGIAWSYCNPLVIINAVLIFLFFKELQVKNIFINEIAKSAFVCFLIHPVFIRRNHIQKVVQGDVIHLVIDMLFTSVFIYIACYFIYFVWNKISDLLFLKVKEKLNRISWEV